jgi:hypothetical protein
MFGYSLSLAKPRVNSFTPEALEYFARAGVTDPLAKQDINTFILGCQQLGIWDKLVYVPCLPSHGGRNQLGGATQLTTTPWALVNATDDTAGVRIVRNGVLNYLRTDQTVNGNDASGVSFGHMSYQDVADESLLNNSSMITRVGSSTMVLGSAAYGATPSQNLFWLGQNSNVGTTIPTGGNYADIVNSYRVSRMHAGSTNGTTSCAHLVENNLRSITHSSAVGFTSSQLSFYPTTNTNGQAGVIQGAFLYYDTMTTLGNSIWRLFRGLITQTFLSRISTRGNTRILITGQSNAGSENLNIRKVVAGSQIGPNEIYFGGVGGVSITQWTNVAPYNRTSRYKLDFWDNVTPSPMQSMWLKSGRYQNVIYWFQGESDTQDATASSLYLTRLTTLFNWVQEDYVDPSMRFVFALIDYIPAYRSGIGAGSSVNFTVSGFTGGLSVLNGVWTFVTITGVNDPYIWNLGIYQLRLTNSTWEFVDTVTSTVLASSTGSNIFHPAIALNWVDGSSNPVSPAFTFTRTEGIEKVRKALRDICSIIPNSSFFDTRSFTRSDDVHISDATYAPALRAHLLANLP